MQNIRMLNKKIILIIVVLITSLGSPEFVRAQSNQPNILLIMGDDCTFSDLSLYGGTNVKTPNIDKLASDGLTFNKAYLSEAMCAPSRAELLTGFYPMTNGVTFNHSATRNNIKGVAQYLRPLGYRVGLSGKSHLKPESVYQFEDILGITKSAISEVSEFESEEIEKFINRDKKTPFFLMTAFTSPHVPWTVGDPSHFNPDKIKLPPHMADTKATREDFCKYLAEIEVLDIHVGKILALLEKSGEAENTIVIFTSEQGAQMPGVKWTNWDVGVHTGFIMKWPNKIKGGQRTDALIQYCDVLPTLLDIVLENKNNDIFDGKSFLKVLNGETEKHRDFVYFMHNNIPEGPSYPIRAVSNGTYTYIRNLSSENLYIEKHVMGTLRWHDYWPSWVYEADTNEHANFLLNRYQKRPKEELYNLSSDPENFKNLIEDKKLQKIKKQLSKQLDLWMNKQNDPGAILDQKEYQEASKSGKHKL
ncbi:uncharacterized sulfatase [Lutibacter agarilyticus]|uniref:Uncharacterized sulfatase n=1 Tax=Lutibacter agarilyticus TaxID=1109740 RepID=A0A238Z4Z9_9FLAO|nr:sulfatase [Lutibacter agarilyticus]SNR77904.1 uncharacterized sulfatase [Lutibacter agarilyticus]